MKDKTNISNNIEEAIQKDLEAFQKEVDSFKLVGLEVQEKVFPIGVMGKINSDHHKGRDGLLSISYDYYSGIWYINHPGYVRDDVTGQGNTLYDAWRDFQSRIEFENKKILKSDGICALEGEVNKGLPESKSVEVEMCSDDSYSVTYYEVVDDGVNHLRYMEFQKGMPTKEDILAKIEKHERGDDDK